MKSLINKKIIGIDLGTTNTVACSWNALSKTVIPITNSEGSKSTPSVISMNPEGLFVGSTAVNLMGKYEKDTVSVFKKLMGRSYNDVKHLKLGYKIVAGDKGEAMVELNNKKVSPVELSSILLKKIKKDAEAQLGFTVEAAVVTVPAYFDDEQRQQTKLAIELAGLETARIINEPTAACMYYGINATRTSNVAVYDFGGGTFDVSTLKIEDGLIEVVSTTGDTELGGTDVDVGIAKYVVEAFEKKHGINLDKEAYDAEGNNNITGVRYRLLEAAERAKKELSSKPTAKLTIPFICVKNGTPYHIDETISQSLVETLFKPLVDKTIDCCKIGMEKAKAKDPNFTIDTVLLVGGSTLSPYVKRRVKEFFMIEPSMALDPMEAVAQGAAVQAGILQGSVEDLILLDVTPFHLGIEVVGGIMHPIIHEQSNIPVSKSQVFSTASDNQPAVSVKVYSGNRKIASDNKLLGEFNLEGVPPAPKGVPQIKIDFSLDRNGILIVKATEEKSGKSMSISIKNNSMSDEEIKKIKQDAQKEEVNDNYRVAISTLRNTMSSEMSSCTDKDLIESIRKEETFKEFFENYDPIEPEKLEASEQKMSSFMTDCQTKFNEAKDKELSKNKDESQSENKDETSEKNEKDDSSGK